LAAVLAAAIVLVVAGLDSERGAQLAEGERKVGKGSSLDGHRLVFDLAVGPQGANVVGSDSAFTFDLGAARPTQGRPPQFVVVSFDGAGSVDLWQHWRDEGKRSGANFTFFVSGVYFLTNASADHYHPPGRPPGTSDIHFIPLPRGAVAGDYLQELLVQMSEGHIEGNEIATHFNGHFCGRGGVRTWSAEDWAQELDQFNQLLDDVRANNDLTLAKPLGFSSTGIVGARTPCLEGDLGVLYPLLKARGFRYDASRTGQAGRWPEKVDGLWSFPLVSIPMDGTGKQVLSMDYNLYAVQTGALDAGSWLSKDLEDQAFRTYLAYFEDSYKGNRAPVFLGQHFAHWNHDAYLRAITRFVETVCPKPEVRCVSYAQLSDWLDKPHPELARSEQ